MNRLTSKNSLYFLDKLSKNYTFSTEELIYKKLGEREDIEERFGVDLPIIFKAIDEGIYNINGKYVDVYLYSGQRGFALYDRDSSDIYFLKDYGKTWTLTRGGLENGKEKD